VRRVFLRRFAPPVLVRLLSAAAARCHSVALRGGDIFHVLFSARWILAYRRKSPEYRTAGTRLRFEEDAALIVLDLTDEIRIDQEAAVAITE
jgi:hypothetical protein